MRFFCRVAVLVDLLDAGASLLEEQFTLFGELGNALFCEEQSLYSDLSLSSPRYALNASMLNLRNHHPERCVIPDDARQQKGMPIPQLFTGSI